MKLSKEVRAYIAEELRNYYRIKKELDSAERDIILTSPQRDINSHVKSTRTSKPVESAVIKIHLDKRIKHMRRIISAIEFVIDDLPKEKKKFVELKYWKRGKRITDIGIARQIPCDKSTLYRWNNEIVSDIAKELGM